MNELVVDIEKIKSNIKKIKSENNKINSYRKLLSNNNFTCSLKEVENALEKYIIQAKKSVNRVVKNINEYNDKVEICCNKYQENEENIKKINTNEIMNIIMNYPGITYEYKGSASEKLKGLKKMDFSQVPIIKAQAIVKKYKDRDISSLTHEEFLEYIGAAAQLDYKKSGILPSVTMAQAICESGWGKYSIGNNLFGIKCGSGWTGKRISCGTKEQSSSGAYYSTTADFRDYDSIVDGVADHSDLLNWDHYAPVKAACDNKDAYEACRQLKACGYATSHTYANTLISIINDNDLTKYDNI